MYSPSHLAIGHLTRVCVLIILGGLSCEMDANAEQADRYKKMEVESDQSGRVDLKNPTVIFNGNVLVTKGTIVMRADRIEVRESPDGNQSAIAFGKAGKTASFRQKRDGMNEFIEGEAERLEYDSKANLIRFIGKASVRRLRGTQVADEVTGALIVYDHVAELFTVTGGAASASASNPSGRVKVVLTPRETLPSVNEAASAPTSEIKN